MLWVVECVSHQTGYLQWAYGTLPSDDPPSQTIQFRHAETYRLGEAMRVRAELDKLYPTYTHTVRQKEQAEADFAIRELARLARSDAV